MNGEVKTYFLTPEELEKERKRLGYNPNPKKKKTREVAYKWSMEDRKAYKDNHLEDSSEK
jgi:hypothetical protein